MTPAAITLLELNGRVSAAITGAPGLNGVWVTAETSDLRVSGGHCYMELIDKDPATGQARARMRAMIWSSKFGFINRRFATATGQPLASDLKVMVCVTVSFHPVYGISATITDIDPEYTVGDLLRRRREMIDRLTREGIIDQNRNLPWPDVPSRIAVISAQGAAGYGDFINQLYTNRYRLRFSSQLFPAVMQGERAAASIIDALDQVAAAGCDTFDCVVIIRGGGATGDLAAFDNYDLAASIALFPLPVIIGIGHERDVTLLDYVANMRVKTPTAAAEWLIGRGATALDRLYHLGNDIFSAASAAISAAHRRLDYMAGRLPLLSESVIQHHTARIGTTVDDTLRTATANIMSRNNERLSSIAMLLDTLSPEATLRRGFSITRADNRTIKSSDDLTPGTVISTTFARGQVESVVK